MELLLPYLAQLGLAGIVFVMLLGLAQLGLTQFFKVLAQTIFKKSDFNFTGLWVLGLSLILGGVLGGVMLSNVAPALGIQVKEPWGGVLAGVVLAAVVSGLVSYQQQRTGEKALSKADGLAALVAQISAAVPAAAVAPPPIILPDPLPTPPPEALSPVTPEDVSRLTRTDWPAVVSGDAPVDLGRE